jgi:glycosyltransferase involved in cell wall biosynthesis
MNANNLSKDDLSSNDTCDFSVVIPVFNEEDNLGILHQELISVLEPLFQTFEIIFIDDGSTDSSFHVLQQLHSLDKRVRVIRFRRNFGQTPAFAAGFDYARGKLILTLDADGQNNPNDIPRFVEKMIDGNYDLIVGWRTGRKEPLLRRLLSNTANRIISKSTGVYIHDRGCSLKLYKSDLVKHMRLYGQMHRFLPEMASVVGAEVAEVPTQDRERRFGKSKYGSFSRTQRVFLDLMTVIFLLGYSTSPMQLFGSLAIISAFIGMVIAGILAGTKIYCGLVGGWDSFHAYQIGNRPLLLLAIMLILVGVQFLMMGLLGEMIMRVYYEARNKPAYFIRTILE